MYVRFYFFTPYTTRASALTFENEMINDRRSSTGRERVGLFVSKSIVSPPPPKQRPSPACRRCNDAGREENRVGISSGKRLYVLAANPVLFGRETGLIRITLIKPFLKGLPICVERQSSCPVIRFRNMRAFAFRLTKRRIFVIKRVIHQRRFPRTTRIS